MRTNRTRLPPETQSPQMHTLEVLLTQKLLRHYGGEIPTQIKCVDHPVMLGGAVTVFIPGQSRTVLVSGKQLMMLGDLDTVEQICEEVRFAIFLLLDGDEDE